MKTQTIAGHKITLEAGTRYLASRPFNEHGRIEYPISIRRITPTGKVGPANILATEPEVVVDGLSYDQANELVNAFNNAASSFEGRVW